MPKRCQTKPRKAKNSQNDASQMAEKDKGYGGCMLTVSGLYISPLT
jgi:hypothetical protein